MQSVDQTDKHYKKIIIIIHPNSPLVNLGPPAKRLGGREKVSVEDDTIIALCNRYQTDNYSEHNNFHPFVAEQIGKKHSREIDTYAKYSY